MEFQWLLGQIQAKRVLAGLDYGATRFNSGFNRCREFDQFQLEPNLATRHSGNVQQIIDEANHMGQLSFHHVAGTDYRYGVGESLST